MKEASSLPLWVQWVQALAPTTIAVVALVITSWIQLGQVRTTRAKLKLDLFLERYRLLEIVRNIGSIGLSGTREEEYFQLMHAEYRNFLKYRLLFPAHIGQLIEELVKNCDDLWASEGGPTASIRAEIRKKMKVLQDSIEDFIRVDWEG